MSPEDWGISLVKCSAEPGRAGLRRDASLLRGSRGSLAASDSDGGVKAAGRNTGSRPAAMFNDKTFYFLMVGAMWKSALSGGMTAKGSVTRLTALSWGQKSA